MSGCRQWNVKLVEYSSIVVSRSVGEKFPMGDIRIFQNSPFSCKILYVVAVWVDEAACRTHSRLGSYPITDWIIGSGVTCVRLAAIYFTESGNNVLYIDRADSIFNLVKIIWGIVVVYYDVMWTCKSQLSNVNSELHDGFLAPLSNLHLYLSISLLHSFSKLQRIYRFFFSSTRHIFACKSTRLRAGHFF